MSWITNRRDAIKAGAMLAVYGIASAQDSKQVRGEDLRRAGAKAADQLEGMRRKAVDFLAATQGGDGSWTRREAVGVTGVIATGLLDAGMPPDEEIAARALEFLKAHVQDDGGIYAEKSSHRNYETSIATMALVRANEDGRYDGMIARAASFLKGLQWDEGEGLESGDEAYGGAGYGKSSRPDLSNTTFFVEALKDAGIPGDDPAMQKALIFISRCQNLESEHNTTSFAPTINDGGFYYTIAAGGSSKAGADSAGGLRSYGGMTYAGLKSMIYAGLDKDDPRAKAAYDWARSHYTLERNPGLGQQGLYYYYQALAKALDALKVERIVDINGQEHDWKSDLTWELLGRQNENGSWVNSSDRWYEGDPHLVTAYVLMALKHCAT